MLKPQLLNTVVEDKVTQVLDQHIANLKDKIDNLETKIHVDLKKNEDVQKLETFPEQSEESDYLERLQTQDRYIQKKDSNPSAKYVESMYGFLSSSAFKSRNYTVLLRNRLIKVLL